MNRRLKIKWAATGLCIALAGFTALWVYRLMTWVLPYLDKEQFLQNYWVEKHAVITTPQQIAFIGLYLPVFIFGLWACVKGMRVLWSWRDGHLFTQEMGQSVFHFGLLLCLAMVADAFLDTFYEMVLSWSNTGVAGKILLDNAQEAVSVGKAKIGLRYHFSNSHITIFLCGAAFTVFGWIWREAALIEEENKGFV
ncbi:MAG: hypothetical protein ACWA40_00230 [Planktomarina sp.]